MPETEAVPGTPPVSNPHPAGKRESLPIGTTGSIYELYALTEEEIALAEG